MPPVEVHVFRSKDGSCPLVEWLEDLESRVPRAYQKCLAFILELADHGNQMRRPHADILRDGIYELRPSIGGIHYRILYFFDGRNVVLSHGLTKLSKVPAKEIDLAIMRKDLVKKDSQAHTEDF